MTLTAAATLGALAGFLLGSVLAIPLAEIHLKQYIDRVAVQEDASVKEAHDLLGVLQHPPYPPCSDAELGYFRQLVFRADYLRDAGRIHEGRIECSATAGRPSRTIGRFNAGPVDPHETAAYSNLVPIRDQSLKMAGIQQGGVFALFGSHLPDVEGSLPIHLAVDLNGGIPSSSPSQASPEAFIDELIGDVTREGDMLVAEHCSPLLSTCVTASVSVSEARRAESAAIAALSVAGGVAGICLGIALCILRRRSVSLDQQLRRAIAQEKLQVVYQPIVNLANGRIVGAEALARWTKQDGVSVSPDVFVKTAEEHGFVGSLTRLVLQRSLKEFGEVFHKLPDFRLNINIAAADLVDPAFLPMLDQAVQQAKVPPRSLVFEVTERSTASQEDAMESIRLLRRRGHGIYLDDFGTGYSNLSYLLYLSIDTIKIDKAFIQAIGTESVTVAILPQIIAMARSLNLGVVVEGIESERQALYFSTDNMKMYGQGWLYGRPVPASEFFKLVGIAVNQPSIIANPDAVLVPSRWRRLRGGIEPVTVH